MAKTLKVTNSETKISEHETRYGLRVGRGGRGPQRYRDDDPRHDPGDTAEDVVQPLGACPALVRCLHAPAEQVHRCVDAEDRHQGPDLLDTRERRDDHDHHARRERVLDPAGWVLATGESRLVPAASRERQGEVRDGAEEEEQRHCRSDGQVEQRPLGRDQGLRRRVEGEVAAHDGGAHHGVLGERERKDDEALDAVERREAHVPAMEACRPGHCRGRGVSASRRPELVVRLGP